jgi:hypothetical protein
MMAVVLYNEPVFQDVCALFMPSTLTRLLTDPRFHNDVRCEVYCRQVDAATVKRSDFDVRQNGRWWDGARRLVDKQWLVRRRAGGNER